MIRSLNENFDLGEIDSTLEVGLVVEVHLREAWELPRSGLCHLNNMFSLVEGLILKGASASFAYEAILCFLVVELRVVDKLQFVPVRLIDILIDDPFVARGNIL